MFAHLYPRIGDKSENLDQWKWDQATGWPTHAGKRDSREGKERLEGMLTDVTGHLDMLNYNCKEKYIKPCSIFRMLVAGPGSPTKSKNVVILFGYDT